MEIACNIKDNFHHPNCFISHDNPYGKITFEEYIKRIRNFLSNDDDIWNLALKLIERSGLCLCSRSYPYLMAVAMTLAIKREDDFFFKNTYIARVFGITAKSLCSLEIELLDKLNFCLYEKNELAKAAQY